MLLNDQNSAAKSCRLDRARIGALTSAVMSTVSIIQPVVLHGIQIMALDSMGDAFINTEIDDSVPSSLVGSGTRQDRPG
jgi:hypothetical protein